MADKQKELAELAGKMVVVAKHMAEGAKKVAENAQLMAQVAGAMCAALKTPQTSEPGPWLDHNGNTRTLDVAGAQSKLEVLTPALGTGSEDHSAPLTIAERHQLILRYVNLLSDHIVQPRNTPGLECLHRLTVTLMQDARLLTDVRQMHPRYVHIALQNAIYKTYESPDSDVAEQNRVATEFNKFFHHEIIWWTMCIFLPTQDKRVAFLDEAFANIVRPVFNADAFINDLKERYLEE